MNHYPTPTPQCGKGHALTTPRSFRRNAKGHRVCLTCEEARTRAQQAKTRARRQLAREQQWKQKQKRQRARLRQAIQKAVQKAVSKVQTQQLAQQLVDVVQRLDAAGLTFKAGIVTVAAGDVASYLRDPYAYLAVHAVQPRVSLTAARPA